MLAPCRAVADTLSPAKRFSQYVKVLIRIGSCVVLSSALIGRAGATDNPLPKVAQVAIDSTGERAAVLGFDKSVQVIDVASGKVIKNFEDDDAFEYVIALDKGGHALAMAGMFKVVIWNTDRGVPLQELSASSAAPFVSVTFSDDGKLLAAGESDGTVLIWDRASTAPPHKLQEHHESAAALAFSHDNRILAIGSWDKTISLWNVKTEAVTATLKGHTNWVQALAFDTTSKRLVSGGSDGLINLWNVSDGKCLVSAANLIGGSIPLLVHSVGISGDNKDLFSVSIGSLSVWNAGTGEKVRSFDHLSAQVKLLAPRIDGRHIAVIGTDGSIALLDLQANASHP